MNFRCMVRTLSGRERRLVADKIVVQTTPDLRSGVALSTGDNIGRVSQFKIAERRCILFKICEKGPFCLAGMLQIVVDPVTLLRMSGFPNLPAAVKADHAQLIYTRFMRLAANPAPNPLSMLTTVTPAAQELSIPSKADNPWKLAP